MKRDASDLIYEFIYRYGKVNERQMHGFIAGFQDPAAMQWANKGLTYLIECGIVVKYEVTERRQIYEANVPFVQDYYRLATAREIANETQDITDIQGNCP